MGAGLRISQLLGRLARSAPIARATSAAILQVHHLGRALGN